MLLERYFTGCIPFLVQNQVSKHRRLELKSEDIAITCGVVPQLNAFPINQLNTIYIFRILKKRCVSLVQNRFRNLPYHQHHHHH